jgi:23S rRNA pseudouridine1911/1915/1917 synthase
MKTIALNNETPERLDKILTQTLNFSRSKIQKAIKQGAILVDGEAAPTKLLVSSENMVEYDPTFFVIPEIDRTNIPNLDIIFEDDDTIVINKPAGVLVHPTESSNELTLIDSILQYDESIKGVGDSSERPGIVHRLDRDASGVMIIAKTQNAFEHLKNQFKNRLVKKHYTVLVHGTLTEEIKTIKLAISRSKAGGRMAAKPQSQGGRESVTHYEMIEQFPHHALIDATIETGRTHQIRAHMFALSHPVAGDKLYSSKKFKIMDFGRLFLHATSLELTLPSGEQKIFESKLPKELKRVLENIPKI